LKLKVIFSGFATANPLDSRVAEARGILQARGPYCDTGFFIGISRGEMDMVLGKICKYYQDSKCLYKRTYCDLYCNQMKYYSDDESDRMDEETLKEERSKAAHSKKEDPVPFL